MEEALRVSVSTSGQLAYPSDGYGKDLQVSLENWTRIPNTERLALLKSDLNFPHGAPLSDVVFIKGKGLFERKRKTL